MARMNTQRLFSLGFPFFLGWFFFFIARRSSTGVLLELQIFLSLLLAFIFGLVIQYIKLKKINYESLIAILLSVTIFFVSVYTTAMVIDRSKSFYLLGWVHDHPGISEEKLAELLKNKYGSYDQKYIGQRISEQLARKVFTGSLSGLNTSYFGDFLYESSSIFAAIFKLEGWYDSKIE